MSVKLTLSYLIYLFFIYKFSILLLQPDFFSHIQTFPCGCFVFHHVTIVFITTFNTVEEEDMEKMGIFLCKSIQQVE